MKTFAILASSIQGDLKYLGYFLVVAFTRPFPIFPTRYTWGILTLHHALSLIASARPWLNPSLQCEQSSSHVLPNAKLLRSGIGAS